MRSIVVIRVVNRLGGFGMAFLGLRLARDLGLDLAGVGTVLGVFGACTIASRVLGGVLATRLGPRPTIVIGLLATASAQLVIGLGQSLATVVAGVVALGLAYEIIEPASQGLIAEHVPAERHTSAFALLWAALSVAGVLSGLLAALLSQWGVGALFVADAASSALAAGAALAWLPSPAPTDPAAHDRTATPWRSAVTAPLVRWTAIATLHATVVMVVVFMLPLAVELAGLRPATTGWLLATAAAAAIAAQPVVRRLEQQAGPGTLLVGGHLVLAAGLALWATGSGGGLFAGAGLEGASGSVLLGSYQATAARMARPGGASAVMAVFGLSWGVATVAAPVIGASLLERHTSVLWLTCAVASLGLAVLHGAITARRDVRARAA
ncbi:MFS transporter [Humibacillus xanthopallidus]|uniref:MFS transporter n=1 Tax=Humibacillus xanthopallidus TaxID=412689 RepID=UPI00384EC096